MNRLHERFPDRYRICYYCAGTGWRPAADVNGRLRNARCRQCAGIGSVPKISTDDILVEAAAEFCPCSGSSGEERTR